MKIIQHYILKNAFIALNNANQRQYTGSQKIDTHTYTETERWIQGRALLSKQNILLNYVVK